MAEACGQDAHTQGPSGGWLCSGRRQVAALGERVPSLRCTSEGSVTYDTAHSWPGSIRGRAKGALQVSAYGHALSALLPRARGNTKLACTRWCTDHIAKGGAEQRGQGSWRVGDDLREWAQALPPLPGCDGSAEPQLTHTHDSPCTSSGAAGRLRQEQGLVMPAISLLPVWGRLRQGASLTRERG